METARAAAPISGDKLYQGRARAALPILVRQAQAGSPMFYSDLAAELEMPNPRNLNFVLGSIGQTLKDLSKARNQEIPPIQCLVVNKSTGLPGEGVGWFITDKNDFGKLPLNKQKQLVDAQLQRIFVFSGWPEVLKSLELEPAPIDHGQLIKKARKFSGGGGESEQHKHLKEYVAAHPELLRLPANSRSTIEYPLPSGDTVDVLFQRGDEYIAVEVKSAIPDESDIVRGIFQCIKYNAVLNAYLTSQQQPQNGRSLLVLEAGFPENLTALKHMLAVQVLANVRPAGRRTTA